MYTVGYIWQLEPMFDIVKNYISMSTYATQNLVLMSDRGTCPSVRLGYFVKHFHDFGHNGVSYPRPSVVDQSRVPKVK